MGFFSDASVAPNVVDGVQIPAFKISGPLLYIVEHIEGTDWEDKVVSPIIAAIRQDGPAAEATAVADAVTEANLLISKISNPIVADIVEELGDTEVSALVTDIFSKVLAVISPPTA